MGIHRDLDIGFRMLNRFCKGNANLAVAVLMAAVAALFLLLYVTGLGQWIVYAFAAVFDFIWNQVLPWPKCNRYGANNDCAALGVIYLPLTIILSVLVVFGALLIMILVPWHFIRR